MAEFLPAFRKVIGEEGGFVDDRVDHGGATNHGITQRTLAEWWQHLGRDGAPTRADVQMLSETEAREIYRTLWWDRYRLGRIDDQAVAEKVFDMAVNMGPHQAVVLAQRAARVDDDGVLGPATLAALNSADPVELLNRMRLAARAFYEALALDDPTQKRFLRGWLARAAR